MSEFKGVGLTRVGLTRVDCTLQNEQFCFPHLHILQVVSESAARRQWLRIMCYFSDRFFNYQASASYGADAARISGGGASKSGKFRPLDPKSAVPLQEWRNDSVLKQHLSSTYEHI